MKIKKQGRRDWVFVLTATDLEKIAHHIHEFLGPDVPIEYTAICADRATREFASLEELLTYPNDKERAIKEIKIGHPWYVNGKGLDKRLDLSFDDNSVFDPVNLSVTGDDHDSVLRAAEAIERVLEGLGPWYKSVAWYSSSLWGSLLCFFAAGYIGLLLFAFAIAALIRGIGGPNAVNQPVGGATGAAIGVAAMFVAGAFAFGAGSLRDWLFPKAVFAIGNGLTRHKNMEVWRIGAVLAFAVGVGASLVASVLTMML